MRNRIFLTLIYFTYVITASEDEDTLVLDKSELKTMYKNAKCCKKSSPAMVADLCVVPVGTNVFTRPEMINLYKNASCCGSTCSLSVENCDVCVETADDLLYDLIVTSKTPAGNVVVSQHMNSDPYAEESISSVWKTLVGDVNTTSTLSDYVRKVTPNEDGTWMYIYEIPRQDEPLVAGLPKSMWTKYVWKDLPSTCGVGKKFKGMTLIAYATKADADVIVSVSPDFYHVPSPPGDTLHWLAIDNDHEIDACL